MRQAVAPIRAVFNEMLLAYSFPTDRSHRALHARPHRSVSADRSLTVAEEAKLLATPRELLPRISHSCSVRSGRGCVSASSAACRGDIDFEGRFIEVRCSLVDGARIELLKNG